MYVCFACIFVCIPHVCLVPKEARKSVLDDSPRVGVQSVGNRNPGPLPELLTTLLLLDNKIAQSVAVQCCGSAGAVSL